MNNTNTINELKAIVGAENVIDEAGALLEESKDLIGFRRYERYYKVFNVPHALCAIKVHSTEDVSNVLKYLNEHKVDVVPRTGGSSVTKGVEPVEGGVVLDGSDMDEIIEFNETNFTVTAKCGTPIEKLEKYANERGYTLGHFPQSFPLAQVGGLIATRSIGQFSTLYGGIEDLVVGLEAVLADGTVIRIKNNPRRSVGPDLRHLFLGCEGMLGFVTEATLKLFKYAPEDRWMCAYAIKDNYVGLEVLREIMTSGYRPAVARLHDAGEVKLQFNSVTPEGMSLLLFLCDNAKPINDVTGAAIDEIVKAHGGISLGTKPVENWLIHRNDGADTLDEGKIESQGVIFDTCEISAQWDQIGEIYRDTCARLTEEIEDLVFCGGHSSHSYTQGTNIYFEFGVKIHDPSTAEKQYMEIVKVIMEETLKRGGSISHHHGSGKYRTEWMPQEHGSSYVLMYKLKDALDENHILNKGILLV